MHARLERWAGQPVRQMTRLEGGWETEVYRCELAGGQRLVLRVYPGAGAGPRAAIEAHVLSRLHATGYPVPRLLGHEPEAFGGPAVLMEFIDGAPMWKVYPGSYMKGEMLDRFCRMLLGLHNVDPGLLVGGPWPNFTAARGSFHLEVLDRLVPHGGPCDDLRRLLGKLQEQEREVGRESRGLIHGDFHSANILVTPAGEAAVIDWSAAALDDPRVDVAQAVVLEFTNGRPAAGAAIRERYEALAGGALTEFDFFMRLALSRRVASAVISISHGAASLGMRPGLETELLKERAKIRELVGYLESRMGMALPEFHRVLEA